MTWPAKLLIIVAALIAGFMGGVKYHVGVVAARNLAQRQSEEKIRARQVDRIDQAATGLEADKAQIRTQFRTITKEVDRVVEKPVYRNVCFDDDGLRLIRAAIDPTTPAGQLAPAVPGSAAAP